MSYEVLNIRNINELKGGDKVRFVYQDETLSIRRPLNRWDVGSIVQINNDFSNKFEVHKVINNNGRFMYVLKGI